MLDQNGINGNLVRTDLNSTRAKTLGDYLKSRRARLQPEQAGLPRSHGQRRTPGLRREEVAILAGVSATYYTWLEQGREVAVSRDVIESIGKALQLNRDEHLHLLELWNANEPEAVTTITTEVKPQWREIVGAMAFPCFISNDRAELLVWNRAVDERLADFLARPQGQRNLMTLLFTDPEMRKSLINWEEMAAHSVATFRTSYDKYARDPWFAQFVAELSRESPEFAALWQLHHVEVKKVIRVFYRGSDENQVFAYDINSLSFTTDHPDLHLCIYTPVSAC
ncbi:helix-turn-helix transcriptional regulator [Paenibacillus macerans]|uniref:helix-turn-helix transcriptional regulator n=1 Tax=Paenibacillus macerans TaxID=44252 RepID=UPI001F0E29D2|nr:helix-turn-helix transcriptional regulator [Paenibacillus macerans]UMV45658.1 helix-turn-helix transcriptional regulator [Paenibacillus macerans]